MNTPFTQNFLRNLNQALLQQEQAAVDRLSAGGQHAHDFLAVATCLRNAGFPNDAIDLLSLALQLSPLSANLSINLEIARAHIAAHNFPLAHQLLAKLEREHPNNCHVYRAWSDLLVREENLSGALAKLRDCPPDSDRNVYIDTLYRSVKLNIFIAATQARAVFSLPKLLPSVDRAVIAMMVRDEADIIGQNLLHHYQLGVRKFVLLINACTDNTEALVRDFQVAHHDATVVSIVDPIEGYYQSDKTQAMVEFAFAYFLGVRRPATWCFVLDADEFISFDMEAGLEHLLSAAERAEKDVIVLHLCNATSSSGKDYDNTQDVYKHFDVIVDCAIPVVPKNAFLFSSRPKISMGNHFVDYPGFSLSSMYVAADCGARLVHLPKRSVKQLRTKIVNGGSAYEVTNLDKGLGAHWRQMYASYRQRGDQMLLDEMARYRALTLHASRKQAKFHF